MNLSCKLDGTEAQSMKDQYEKVIFHGMVENIYPFREGSIQTMGI